MYSEKASYSRQEPLSPWQVSVYSSMSKGRDTFYDLEGRLEVFLQRLVPGYIAEGWRREGGDICRSIAACLSTAARRCRFCFVFQRFFNATGSAAPALSGEGWLVFLPPAAAASRQPAAVSFFRFHPPRRSESGRKSSTYAYEFHRRPPARVARADTAVNRLQPPT